MTSNVGEPTLTTLTGHEAKFLSGGEFPIPVSQSLGSVSIEYKQYGVGLAFTPIVLADGRISMRVRPEVSELSNEGAVKLNDFLVPALKRLGRTVPARTRSPRLLCRRISTIRWPTRPTSARSRRRP